MDADQQATLDAILGQSPSNETETAQATTPSETPPETAPAPTPDAAPAVETPHPSAVRSRHDELMEKLMGQAREAREKQVAEKNDTSQEDLALARRIKEASQYGPDAVLKAAGVEKPSIDFSKLFEDDKEDPKDQTVKQLEERLEKLDAYIKDQDKTRAEEQETNQQKQQQQWAEQEIQRISTFIDEGKEKFEYLSAAREMGSDKDLYNGMVSMYNQGYSPSYDDMADLVEARIEKLLDLVGPTKKFSAYMSKRYGVQINSNPAESQTLTGGMASDPPAMGGIEDLPDEEQQKLALKAAVAAKEAALKKLQQP